MWISIPSAPTVMTSSFSGILVQFTAIFGLNADDNSNEETGTTPDLISADSEKSLATALRAIKAQKGTVQ
ncbi:hypothetical protein V6615_12200 [Oscillospiraceae bacterium PP1C4]